MKKLLAAAVLLALTATVHAQTPPLNRTQEYRVWSAERMIDRLVERYARTRQTRFSEAEKEALIKTHPILNSVREIAANGDDVDWARLIDAVHKYEKDL